MTATFNDTGTRNFTANSTPMDQHARVVLNSSGYLALAGAEDKDLGTLAQKSVGTASESLEVHLANKEGTSIYIASGAIAVHAPVYGAASGKVSATENGNYLGIALNVTTADGDKVEVLPLPQSYEPIDGGVTIDEDFLGDWPAAATALTGQGRYSWTKTETNGLGVTAVDGTNGVLKFAFDAVAEAATATLFMENSPLTPTGGTVEFILGIFDIGDDAALDIDFGVASDDHATDFESIDEFVAFHLNGANLSLLTHSDDGTTDTAAVDSGVDLVDDTYYCFKIDWTDNSDVKFYYRAMGATTWTRLNSGTTFDVSASIQSWTPIVMVEKTSNDTTADVRLDRIRVNSTRV